MLMTVHVDMLCADESAYRSAMFYGADESMCGSTMLCDNRDAGLGLCVGVDMHVTCHTKNDKQ